MAGGLGRVAGEGSGFRGRGGSLRRFCVGEGRGLRPPGVGALGIVVPVPVPVPVPDSSSSTGSAAADSAPGRVGAWGSVYSGWWTGWPAAAAGSGSAAPGSAAATCAPRVGSTWAGAACVSVGGAVSDHWVSHSALPEVPAASGAPAPRCGRARAPRGRPPSPGQARPVQAPAPAAGAAMAAAEPAPAAAELAAVPAAAVGPAVGLVEVPEEVLLVPAADAESAPGRLLLRFSSHQMTATTTMMTTSQTIQSIAEPFSPYSAHEAWLPMLDVTSGRSRLSSIPGGQCRAP